MAKATPTRSANTRTPPPPASARTRPRLRTFSSTKPLLLRGAALVLGLALLAAPAELEAQRKKKKQRKPKPVPCRTGCKPATSVPDLGPASPEDAASQKDLAELARALHNAAPGAYDKLAAFAGRNAGNVWGARAALALGYDDYSKNRAAQASQWLVKAKGDTLLVEYVLYWSAQAKRAQKRNAEALADLEKLQNDYSNSAMREQLLEALAPTAIELGRPQVAIDALNANPATASKPVLLLERANAYRVAHQLPRAAKDYQTIFYKFPLSDEARAAGGALPALSRELGKEYNYPGVELQEQRAQAFFDAHKWREARSEFEKLLTMLRDPANPVRQRAQLRVAQCRVQQKGSPALLSAVAASDPEVDAERLFALSQAYRTAKRESEMLRAAEEVAQKYPQSKWAEEALMATGNYYWVQLDRRTAAGYYQRVLDVYPAGKNDFNAEWRIAWVAYLLRQPEAADKLRAFLLKYPASSNAPDALYWLGRDAERGGNPAHARTFYRKTIERFPQTYFRAAAAARLAQLGPGEGDPVEFLEQIPPPPALRPFDEPIPAAAADRWARAQALRAIAFDSSAELELKAAYFATSSPRFLLEAAQAAFDQGHFATGMAYARLMVPNFDSRNIDELPAQVWKALYPLPYETAVRRESVKNSIDPMVAAGLIRQESTFQADAVSHANAIGLMQLLPKTAKILAKQLRIRYAKDKLFDPEYNVQLGTYYFKGLVQLTGAPEFALAAYNAGEDRIALWKSERTYEEIPELVESIPFTETREYVQVVLRNAEVYRMVYGPDSGGAVKAAAAGGESARYR